MVRGKGPIKCIERRKVFQNELTLPYTHKYFPYPLFTYQNIFFSGTAGYYCSGYGLSTPDGPCQAGFYCPPGQIEAAPADKRCESGHFCPTGSESHYPCQASYYQPLPAQPTCLLCPSGKYCDPTDSNTSRINEG